MIRTSAIVIQLTAVVAVAVIGAAPPSAAAESRITGPEVMADGGLTLGVVREQRDDIWEWLPTAGLQLHVAGAPVRVRIAGTASGRHVDVTLAPEVSLATWRNDVSSDVAGGLGARLELRLVSAAGRTFTGYVGGRRRWWSAATTIPR
ncbi:MAG: hypothetical protein IPL61_27290 [Myxococcales bacterium]|nr:hypothetical protein [Myxococcales bacterium]